MRERCRYKKGNRFYRYGARGISVCDRWNIFENFLEDMGERPEGMQIDRIDNDGDYCKENCRWVTPRQNSVNKKQTKLSGAYWHKQTKKWLSSIKYKKNQFSLGLWETESEAHIQYLSFIKSNEDILGENYENFIQI